MMFAHIFNEFKFSSFKPPVTIFINPQTIVIGHKNHDYFIFKRSTNFVDKSVWDCFFINQKSPVMSDRFGLLTECDPEFVLHYNAIILKTFLQSRLWRAYFNE